VDIAFEVVENIGLITLKGELDARTAPDLEKFFAEKLSRGTVNFVVNLKDLAYSSSAGIRIFLGSARETRRQGGDLRLAAVQHQVDKIFKMSKFDRIVKIYETVEKAQQSYVE
jgi:anti-sigma B factor antagonist